MLALYVGKPHLPLRGIFQPLILDPDHTGVRKREHDLFQASPAVLLKGDAFLMSDRLISIFALPVDDGYGGIEYHLTPAGYACFVALMLLVLLLASAISGWITKKEVKISLRQLSVSAMAVALASVLFLMPSPHMPMGGRISLCTMLVVALVGYWFGLSGGVACGVAFGILQLILDPYILSLPQLLCDYIFSFGALGLSGLFPLKKGFAPEPGYLVAVIGRFFFAVLSGVVFFAAYAPTEGIFSNALLYAIAYNGIYIGAEVLITLAILRIPAVRNAIAVVGRQTLTDRTAQGSNRL